MQEEPHGAPESGESPPPAGTAGSSPAPLPPDDGTVEEGFDSILAAAAEQRAERMAQQAQAADETRRRHQRHRGTRRRLALLIPLLLILRKRIVAPGSVRFSSTDNAARVGMSLKRRLAFIPVFLRALAIACLITAIAGPRTGKEEIRDVSRGIAIEMVVDRSGSMGAEMDLIPAYPQMVEKIRRWNEKHPETRLEFSTTTQYFENVDADRLPTFRGEAPYEFFALGACRPATYTQAKYAHQLLMSAEKMAAAQEILSLGHTNKASLDRAWDALFIPQDHNVGGRHGELNDAVRHHCVEEAMFAAQNVSEEAMLSIMTHIGYPDESGIPVVVFNSLSWTRTEVVETYIETKAPHPENIAVFDPLGELIPTQFIRCEENQGLKRVHFLFLAKDMPPVGYKTFYIKIPDDGPNPANSSLKASEMALENRFMRISLQNGCVTSVLWKEGGTELVREGETGFAELMVCENTASDIGDEPTGRIWREKEENRSVQVLESGPVRAKVRIESEVLGCSVTKEFVLYDHLPQAEVSIGIDWQGERNRELLVAFPLNVIGGKITYETP